MERSGIHLKKVTHPVYKDYPEQPYISPYRDLKLWEKYPERFPYGIVDKKQMQRLAEGILPGHVVLLWRIHLTTFTNQSVIPQYFEYRYGVDSKECVQTLQKLGFAQICSAKESLDALNMIVLKRILQSNGLETKGKKGELLQRIQDNLSEQRLAELFPLRKYKTTSAGEELISKYDSIIKKHGPKR